MSQRKGWKSPRTVTVGLRAKAWWVLRKNRSMTLAELMLTVCDGSEGNAETNLRRWLGKLTQAGIFSRVKVADSNPLSSGSYRYTLMKDIGPKAPVVRASAGEVYDPNSGETIITAAGGGDE